VKFRKGQSGNPGGRPKVLAEVQELARQHAPSAIAELARLAVKAKSETARIAANRQLLDRGYGRARQSMEDSVPTGDPLNLVRLMMEEIDVIERKRTYNQVPKAPAAGQALLLDRAQWSVDKGVP
jgi:hypothetical protein